MELKPRGTTRTPGRAEAEAERARPRPSEAGSQAAQDKISLASLAQCSAGRLRARGLSYGGRGGVFCRASGGSPACACCQRAVPISSSPRSCMPPSARPAESCRGWLHRTRSRPSQGARHAPACVRSGTVSLCQGALTPGRQEACRRPSCPRLGGTSWRCWPPPPCAWVCVGGLHVFAQTWPPSSSQMCPLRQRWLAADGRVRPHPAGLSTCPLPVPTPPEGTPSAHHMPTLGLCPCQASA